MIFERFKNRKPRFMLNVSRSRYLWIWIDLRILDMGWNLGIKRG